MERGEDVGIGLNAGDVLAERYLLSDLLSESTHGRFWRARDLVLERDVAVHVVAPDATCGDRLVEAARSAAPLHDPRLLRVLDAHQGGRHCYVVNEWGAGRSLDDIVITEGPLAPRRAAWIVAEVADCLAAAHEAGLAHGWLVPENVLIDQNGNVRLIGFGVEAALHGLPPGRRQVDLTDLISLLYAALTGKWAGVTASQLPAAPAEHGTVLRPRRVRAGVPRILDGLCDELLNPLAPTRTAGSHRHDVSTARGIADLLHEFVGDAGQVLAIPLVPPAAPPDAPTPVAPAEVVPPVAPATAPSEPVGEATQAGMPLFHDDDEVGWLRTQGTNAAPPPEPTPLTPRPLFAPDPPAGQPVRRARPGVVAPPADYWPWDEPRDVTATGTGVGRHAGDTSTQPPVVPGRRWFQLALLVGFVTVVILAALMAWQVGKNSSPPDTSPTPGGPTTSTGTPEPFTHISGTDFDPEGDPAEEYPELVPLALDGKPVTQWTTQTYRENFGPGGLKDGVGLLLDLGASRAVRQVDVTTSGGDTAYAIYLSPDPITSVDAMEPAAQSEGDGKVKIDLAQGSTARYVVVWLTSIPQHEDGFRGAISEIAVKG